MDPLVLLLIGMTVVVGGILVFRLHAFLALILGAFLIAALTPRDAVRDYEISSAAVRIEVPDEGDAVILRPTKKQTVVTGRNLLYRPLESGVGLEPAGEGTLVRRADGTFAFGPSGEAALKNKDRIVHHTLMDHAAKTADRIFPSRVATGFGNTCTSIGILIAMAAIVGKCLLDSGAAERIVLSLRNLFGRKGSPMAFTVGGFTLGIPVFFDTVFYLMMPLGKALHVRTGSNYLLYVLSIVCGATIAHSLVPPTPGPLLVASELDVEIGTAMLAGLAVGIPVALIGLLFALVANKFWSVPLRPSAELSEEDLKAMAGRDPESLPGLFVSLLPILLPVLLLAAGTAHSMIWNAAKADAVVSGIEPAGWLAATGPTMRLLGDKNFALTVAAITGLLLLAIHGKKSRREIQAAVGSAITGGASIILITAAGGAFGHALRQTGIASAIQELDWLMSLGLLPLAFLVTTVIRTAQGSATVAMITAAGIISPLVIGQELPFHPVYVFLAIGFGSKPISWMNDSGFWVISKMSGLTEGEMLKTNTVMGSLMAGAGLGLCLLGARYLPLLG